MSTHIVILLHGIRTRAFWYDVAKPILSEIDGLIVKPIGYGYFNIFQFLTPLLTRRRPAKRVAKAIRNILWEMRQQDVKVSVIAHSFGTYTIASVLETETDIELENLILCGSVLKQDHDFGAVRRQVANRIVNDAGARDVWPVLAKVSSFGFGESGTSGFQSEFCEDRFHDLTHGDFFSEEFIRHYWSPIFARNEIVASQFTRRPNATTKVLGFISMFPAATLPVLTLAAALSFFRPTECYFIAPSSWCHHGAGVRQIRAYVNSSEANRNTATNWLRNSRHAISLDEFLSSDKYERDRLAMIADLRIP